MDNRVVRRINQLNALLTLASQVYEDTWVLDYKDTYGEFTDELRPIMDAAQALENKVMKEVEQLRKQL